MSTIHISLNELENVSYKALESLKYEEGFCEAISKDLTFLQAMGFPALLQFVDFLSFCENDTTHQHVHPIIRKSDDEDPNKYLCDCLNISCIHFIEPLVEYIINLVKENPKITVLFSNSCDYVFLLPYLQKFSPLPLSMKWHNKKQNKCNMSFIFPNNKYPELFSRMPQKSDNLDTPTLVAYASTEGAYMAQQKYADMCVHFNRLDCVHCFEHSVSEGLFVDENEWQLIQDFEKAVLVPSSEVSRGGAGETVHAVDVEDLLFEK